MSRITSQEVRYIAELARLALDEGEIGKMAADLDRVLDYIATIDEIDVSDVEPTAHVVRLDTPTRDDESDPGMDPELAIAGAPQRRGTAFSVPKVIDEGEG